MALARGYITITVLNDGEPGVPGTPAYSVVLTKESQGIACNADGSVKSGELGSTSKTLCAITCLKGASALSAVATTATPTVGQYKYIATCVGGTIARRDNTSFYLSAMTEDVATVSVAIHVENVYVFTKQVIYTKIKDGAQGDSWSPEDRDEFAQKLGYADYADAVDQASKGETIVKGGYINTQLIQANAITAEHLSANFIYSKAINVNGKFIVDPTGKIVATEGVVGGFNLHPNKGLYIDINERSVAFMPTYSRSVPYLTNTSWLWANISGYFKAETNDPIARAIYARGFSEVNGRFFVSNKDSGLSAVEMAKPAMIVEGGISVYGQYSGLSLSKIRSSSTVYIDRQNYVFLTSEAGNQSVYLPASPDDGMIIFIRSYYYCTHKIIPSTSWHRIRVGSTSHINASLTFEGGTVYMLIFDSSGDWGCNKLNY